MIPFKKTYLIKLDKLEHFENDNGIIVINENKENLVPCIDGTKYLLYRSMERQVIETVEDFLNGDKK